MQDTICNQEDALLAAAEEIRVVKVEKKHFKVKKSPKSKTMVKRKKAFSSKVAKRLSFKDLGVAQPVLKNHKWIIIWETSLPASRNWKRW